MSTIRVVIKEPDQAPREASIDNDLPGLQAAVGGGLVESFRIDADLFGLVDEDGPRKQLPANVRVGVQVLVGPLVVVTIDPTDVTEFGSLSEAQVAATLARFVQRTKVWTFS